MTPDHTQKGTGTPCLLFTIAIAKYRVPIPIGTCSSGPSQKGASPSPTRRQYPVLRDSACSSVQFWSRASSRKFIPRAPRNWDWVIGPWTDTSPAKGLKIGIFLQIFTFTLSSEGRRWGGDTTGTNTMGICTWNFLSRASDGSKINICTEISGSRIIQNVDKLVFPNCLTYVGLGWWEGWKRSMHVIMGKLIREKKNEKSIKAKIFTHHTVSLITVDRPTMNYTSSHTNTVP